MKQPLLHHIVLGHLMTQKEGMLYTYIPTLCLPCVEHLHRSRNVEAVFILLLIMFRWSDIVDMSYPF